MNRYSVEMGGGGGGVEGVRGAINLEIQKDASFA